MHLFHEWVNYQQALGQSAWLVSVFWALGQGAAGGQQTRITSKLLSTMAKMATAASKGKLHVLRLDSGAFCVDGAEVGFL